MSPVLINIMVYAGAALMVGNIIGFISFARFIRGQKSWKTNSHILYIPILLLVLFLLGYLAVGIFGQPDLLELEEIEAEHAENGEIAVRMFSDHPAGYYDAILMDVRMPVTDGLTATRKIRALPRPDAAEIPIIAMTANVFDEDVQHSMEAGMNAHLFKPVEPEKLTETLERLIRRKEG